MRVVLALLCALLTLSVAGPALAAPSDDLGDEVRRRLTAREAAAASVATERGDTAAVAAEETPQPLATAQSTTTAYVGDATWEAEVYDARGDLIAGWADYRRGDVLRVGVHTSAFESPTAYNWAWGATMASWYLDTAGDADEDYEVHALTVDGRPSGLVMRVRDGHPACLANFTASAGGGYVVDLPASCIGDPGRVRFWADLGYDQAPDDPDAWISYDMIPDEDYYSSWASRGARPFRHAKPAARRGATFYLRDDLGAGVTDHRTDYGVASDVPLLCDWDGNGSRTLGVFRDGRWWIRNTNGGGLSTSFAYGAAGDVPVCGDWNGDGRDTPGVYRAGRWYLRPWLTHGLSYTATYGLASDRPIVGDWDGDGRDTVGAVRGSIWYLRGTGGTTASRFDYGYPWDVPLAGDWDGDGRDTPGVYRDGEWLVRNTLTSGRVAWAWSYGVPGDTPLVWE